MDKDTKKFLLGRANECRSSSSHDRRSAKLPAAVKRAKRILQKFQNAEKREWSKRRKAFERAKARALDAIHFGTEKQARAAVEKLEAFK